MVSECWPGLVGHRRGDPGLARRQRWVEVGACLVVLHARKEEGRGSPALLAAINASPCMLPGCWHPPQPMHTCMFCPFIIVGMYVFLYPYDLALAG